MGEGPRRELSRIRRAHGRVGVALLLLLTFPAGAPAQEPVPPDSAAADSLARDTLPPDSLAADTLPADSVAQDTLPPPPDQLITLADSATASDWAGGVWQWDRDALLRDGALTVGDLLERIPGVIPIRSGFLLQDEAISVLGGTVTPVRLFIDGFAIDPLTAPSLDLSRIELMNVERIRVERGFDGLQVDLFTLSPAERDVVTVLEIGTGDLDTNLFRGTLLAPRFLGHPLGAGFERLGTDGFGGREPANHTATWLKYGIVRDRAGIQLELRRSSFGRERQEGPGADGERTDWTVRARGEPVPGLVAEAYAGASSAEALFDTTTVRESGAQAGLRARLGSGASWVAGTLRARTNPGLPEVEGRLRAGQSLSWLRLRVAADWARWPGSGTAASVRLQAETEPVLGVLRPFADVQAGEYGVPHYRKPDGAPLLLDRRGARLGGELRHGGLHLGGAALLMDGDAMPAFGLAFDRTPETFPGGGYTGFELSARLPTWWETMWLEGWYVDTPIDRGWVYTPSYSWWAALNYRTTPLESGNLEVAASLRARGRGPMPAPALVDPDGPGTGEVARPLSTVVLPGQTVYDLHVHLRIVGFRLFIRWDNLGSDVVEDLPGRPFPRQRLFTGIKWIFRN